ncbi:hypothetical protein B0H14DRAFT_3118282 [Mycena olivaceomarginata]|nr:hypothetical protein B0H14DRAFT_3118282 [Mycena olivaceomarginata]
MSAQKTALILGSTGQVGRRCPPQRLLASSTFTRIGEFGRRNTPLDALPAAGKDKLEQKVLDFEKLEGRGPARGQVGRRVHCARTTAKAAGSSEAFERIDREYVINAARAAKSEGHPQRLVYVSVGVADPKSYFLYPRSKGLTEEGLAGLGYEDTIVFRPGMLAGTTEPSPGREKASLCSSRASPSRFSSSLQIKIGALAKSLIKAGELGSAGMPAEAKATQAGKDGARSSPS